MNTVHHQTYNVGTRHPWKLLGDDVLQVNQVAHILQCPIIHRQYVVSVIPKTNQTANLLVISHDHELYQALLFFAFDFDISFASPKTSLNKN